MEDAENTQKDLDSKTESEFLESKIEGLGSLFTNDSNIKYESLDTKLTVSMLMAWPYIHKKYQKLVRSVLSFWLAKLGESQIGSYERVEKFFRTDQIQSSSSWYGPKYKSNFFNLFRFPISFEITYFSRKNITAHTEPKMIAIT